MSKKGHQKNFAYTSKAKLDKFEHYLENLGSTLGFKHNIICALALRGAKYSYIYIYMLILLPFTFYFN